MPETLAPKPVPRRRLRGWPPRLPHRALPVHVLLLCRGAARLVPSPLAAGRLPPWTSKRSSPSSVEVRVPVFHFISYVCVCLFANVVAYTQHSCSSSRTGLTLLLMLALPCAVAWPRHFVRKYCVVVACLHRVGSPPSIGLRHRLLFLPGTYLLRAPLPVDFRVPS